MAAKQSKDFPPPVLNRVFPWRYLLRRAAARHGFIDPLNFMARIRRFSQPASVQEPIELIRTGIERHAQGVINTKAIQSNMDWIWPFWVERQFRPDDPSFVPRGFSFSHLNITHRNWTAVSMPDSALYPLIDPRGLVTPLFGGWSVDFWLRDEDGQFLLPSRLGQARQHQQVGERQEVITEMENDAGRLKLVAWMEDESGRKVLHVHATGEIPKGGDLVAAVRPYNVEGVQFIEQLEREDETALRVNKETRIRFDRPPYKVLFSDYAEGDVYYKLSEPANGQAGYCKVGMGSAAAMFKVLPGQPSELEMRVPLDRESKELQIPQHIGEWKSWPEATKDLPKLEIPDERMKQVFRDCLTSLVQLSAEDIYPGPLTYRRFWFRDACLMLNGMLSANMLPRARRAIDGFFKRQTRDGFFRSQEGEWDANGQVLWITRRYAQISGKPAPQEWMKPMGKAADWIGNKRLNKGPDLHRGLLPPGFSAEHFGSSDYYYWDNFWAVGGLRAAASLFSQWGDEERAVRYRNEADGFLQDILRSLGAIERGRGTNGAMPTGPYRRMDAAAVGALVCDYPLGLFPPGSERVKRTYEFLISRCFYRGSLFHDLSHSGLNVYLTLAIAQSLLRVHDPRCREVLSTIRDMASDTGHWPEAIHPRTLAGSMGDGQHGWASSEFVMLVRNLFVREEEGALILLSGIYPEWLDSGPIRFGPTSTPWGKVAVRAEKQDDGRLHVALESSLRQHPSQLVVAPPGYSQASLDAGADSITLDPA